MARKLLLLFTTVSLSVLAVEVVFRVTRPQRAFRAASELENFRLNPEDLTRYFEIDPGFGFRPILGGELYSEYGTRANEYVIEKPTDKTRLLFLVPHTNVCTIQPQQVGRAVGRGCGCARAS